MPREVISPTQYMRGAVRLHRVFGETKRCVPLDADYLPGTFAGMLFRGRPNGWWPLSDFSHNDFLYEWGKLFGNLLLRKGLQYGIGGMYIEFENVASPGDPVVTPTFNRSEGISYYDDLAGSSDRDYLRCPLVAGTLEEGDTENITTFFAQTSGVSGVHGKAFSDANNSKVYGGALVAFVDEEDPTRDLVLSRFYVLTAQQQVKLATSQIGFEWRLTLG